MFPTKDPIAEGKLFQAHAIAEVLSGVQYLEAGSGPALVVLCRDLRGAAATEAFEHLALRCRVILLEAEMDQGTPVDRAAVLARAANDIVGGHFGLLGSSDYATLAVLMASRSTQQIDSLILVAPHIIQLPSNTRDIAERLRESLAALASLPMLVLFGTEDDITPPELGRHYVEALPECFFILVYGAGHAIERDRPEAFAAIVGDFVVQPTGGFLIPRESSIINP